MLDADRLYERALRTRRMLRGAREALSFVRRHGDRNVVIVPMLESEARVVRATLLGISAGQRGAMADVAERIERVSKG